MDHFSGHVVRSTKELANADLSCPEETKSPDETTEAKIPPEEGQNRKARTAKTGG